MQIPIRAIFVFYTAARLGSISKAAEDLSVTPSAVSQQIQALEMQLGLTLMNKVGRRVVLTEAGERYFASITDEMERIAEATNLIRGYRTVTTLTVRAILNALPPAARSGHEVAFARRCRPASATSRGLTAARGPSTGAEAVRCVVRNGVRSSVGTGSSPVRDAAAFCRAARERT